SNRGPGFRVYSQDGEKTYVKDLKSAIHQAIGGRGLVELCDAAPILLKSAELEPISGGKLEIRAAEGFRPALIVEALRRLPCLAPHSYTPMVLQGLRIEAKFVASTAEPPPVIQASAAVTLDRCAFVVQGAPPRGTRAVAAAGGSLFASGCWFDGFDKALDV